MVPFPSAGPCVTVTCCFLTLTESCQLTLSSDRRFAYLSLLSHMWSDSDNGSFMACAADSSATLELIGAAVSREELNALYVKNGTLLILTGGTKKVAHKVSQTGGSKAPFRVHFAACPGTKPVADTIINIEDLAGTMNANGRLAGAEHLLFGYKGGAFRGANGMHLHVVDVVGAAGREGSISKVEPAQARRRAQRAALVRIRVSVEHVHGRLNHNSIRSVNRKGTRPVENLSPPPNLAVA